MTFCSTREDFRSDVSPPHRQKHTFLHLFNAADIIIIIIRFFCLKTKRLGRRKSSWETLGDDLWYFEDPVSGRFTQKRPEVNSNIKKTTLKNPSTSRFIHGVTIQCLIQMKVSALVSWHTHTSQLINADKSQF